MEQVRELLMGTQLKDLENRILRQEERFNQEIADLRDIVKNRVESLENFMKSESASLLHRLKEEKSERAAALKNEQRERTDAIKAEQKERVDALKLDKRERDEALSQLTKDLLKKEEAFDRKLAALSSTLDTAEQELRQLLLSESARLSATTEEKYKDALAALSRTAAQLRNDLVSRSALSALFTENAVKLAGDISLSESTENAPLTDKKDGKADTAGS
ncbi:MAG: hypothetical protein LIP28_06970 [Deltaproteobacteria bacterium]|nr:hypothetical protein [Deltaproteobacteria bacterium]